MPYDLAALQLPIVQMKQPIFKGKQLFLEWGFASDVKDVSADTYFLNVFKETKTCPYCEESLIETLEISTRNNQITTGRTTSNNETMLKFISFEQTNQLCIEKPIWEQWQKKGLYYFAMTYQTESGLISSSSEKVTPTDSLSIPLPMITIRNRIPSANGEDTTLLIQWKLIPEFVYQTVDSRRVSGDIIKYFGLNLYRISSFNEEEIETRLNDQPLESGTIEVIIGNYRLYGRHVDRYGNESDRVLILDASLNQNQ